MIAPITGKLRKRFLVDLSSALGLGTAAAYTWWYGYHLKSVARQEQYYLKLEQEKLAQKA